jgi:hypothetical protein
VLVGASLVCIVTSIFARRGPGFVRPRRKFISCAPPETEYVVFVDWQQIVSLMIVGVTAAVLLWSKFRPRKFSLARDTHCGCSSPGQTAPQSTMIFRARRGERPQITVKMK